MPISVTTGDPTARAQNAAQLKYGGQEDAIKRAIANLATSQAANEAAVNQYGNLGRTAIGDTFSQLLGNLATNRQLTASDLGTQAAQIGQGYRDAAQLGQAASDKGLAQLQQLAGVNPNYSTMNLAGAANPLVALAAQQVANASNTDAATTGNLKNWAAQQDALLRAGEAGAQRDKSNQLSSFETNLLGQLASGRNTALGSQADLQSQLLAMLNERGSYTADQAAQFADTGFGQQLQAAQYNLSEADSVRQAQQAAASLAAQAASQAFQQSQAALDNARQDKQMTYAEAQDAIANQLKQDALQQDNTRYADTLRGQQDSQQLQVAKMLSDAQANEATSPGTFAATLAALQAGGFVAAPQAAIAPVAAASGPFTKTPSVLAPSSVGTNVTKNSSLLSRIFGRMA